MDAPFIANTDKNWFDFLAKKAIKNIIDEVNFWQPKSTKPMKRMMPGTPIFFRLKKPYYKIVGYGFYSHFQVLPIEEAWSIFKHANGDPTLIKFLSRLSGYRSEDMSSLNNRREPIGCTILRDAHFWPKERWIPWGENEGWKRNIVQGTTENDPTRQKQLFQTILNDKASQPLEFSPEFKLLSVDKRTYSQRNFAKRIGQGTFRLRLINAYKQCAITREHTLPVLAAAHIQPYLGPESNHIQNGLLLTQDFHTLFDRGYITITPDFKVKVSQALHDDWNDGQRYYQFQNRSIVTPHDKNLLPSQDALAWHQEHVFFG